MSTENSTTRKKILRAAAELLEQSRGGNVRMKDIAEAAGVSRQAVYLNFGSRTQLMVAATHYVDEVRGLAELRSDYEAARTGVEALEAYVEFWGGYIPEVYGVAKALMDVRETDEAAAAAWADRMNAVHASCRETIEALRHDGMLAPEWSREEAVDLLWTMLSIRNWEHLTLDCGWTQNQYVDRMKRLSKSTFVRGED